MLMKFPALTALAAFALLTSVGRADEAKLELKTKPYPLETCVVSGEKLDAMGEAYVFTSGNQEIQLCCKSCLKDFNKDQEAMLQKVAAAWKKVKAYPLATCIVSGEKLEAEDAVGIVHGKREFRFCCKGCLKDFKKNPEKFAKKLDAAAKAKS